MEFHVITAGGAVLLLRLVDGRVVLPPARTVPAGPALAPPASPADTAARPVGRISAPHLQGQYAKIAGVSHCQKEQA